ncbi:MAG TPA: hypothetical protein VLK26_06200 [Rudaea sp.]|nr:hypothetical protein [Rudaea sp.]
MWKWLRNIVLLAIVLAGALKLGAWYAVGHDAQRIVDALAPYAEIKYDGLAAGLDGSVTITGVSVAPKGSHRIYRADSVAFDSPGLFWLLKHALLHENDLPAQFGLGMTGLSLPPEPWLDPLWLDPATFTLFTSAGCESRLGSNDYRRMELDPATPSRQRFEYRYDANQHTLTATLGLSAPGFATLALEADLSRFDPTKLMQPKFWDTTHFDQLSATYTDHGFMQRRDAYCAKRVDLGTEQFADRHIAAVQTLLQKSRIQPADEVMQMYRSLAAHGGSLRLLSLPNSVFSLGAWDATSREDLLRQLNVTARYQNKPPIMFRLAFLSAPESTPPSSEESATAATPVPAALSGNPAASAAPPNPAPAPTNPAAAAGITAAVPPPPAPTAKEAAAGTKPIAAPTLASATPPATNPVPEKSSAPIANPKPEDFLDRAEAKLFPPKPVAPVVPSPPKPVPPVESTASTDAPTTSTQALIWKPGIVEELPEATPLQKDYSVVEFSSLPQLAGRHIRLITVGGKQIEGFVASADDRRLQLRIERGGGHALIAISRDGISQIQLLHW